MNAKRTVAALSIACACCAVPLSGCSVSIDVDEAVSGALDSAQQAVDAALTEAGSAFDDALAEARATLSDALSGVASQLDKSLAELGETLVDAARIVDVIDAQTGAAVTSLGSLGEVAAALGSLDYGSWHLASGVADSDARYAFVFLQGSVESSARELFEIARFTTYDDGFVKVEVMGSGISALFEVPQADVDALNALVE